jgi:hypothetical protein
LRAVPGHDRFGGAVSGVGDCSSQYTVPAGVAALFMHACKIDPGSGQRIEKRVNGDARVSLRRLENLSAK